MTSNMWLAAICVAVTLVAVAMAARTVARMVRVIRLGQPDPTRSGPWCGRTRAMLTEFLAHTRLRSNRAVGAAHWLVMIGFLGLVPNVVIAYAEVIDPSASWPLIGHWAVYQLFVEILGVGTVLGIGVLIVIRQLHHPRREGRSSRFTGSHLGRAYFVEAVVLLEGVGVLGVQASSHAAGLTEPPLWAAPVSRALGALLPANPILVSTMAAIKILVAMTWLIVVASVPTMGVAWHRFTAFVNLYARREPDGRPALGAAKPMMSGGRVLDLEEADPDQDTFGIGNIQDVTWKGLLDTVTCTECGRCQSVCPAWGSGAPLSPKLLVTGLRDHLFEQAPALLAARERGTGEGNGEGNGEGETTGVALVGGSADEGAAVAEDALWACTTCGACVDACPVAVEHVDHILDLRRHQVLIESEFPRELAGTFRNLETRGNPWGLGQRERMTWAENLSVGGQPVKVPVVGRGGAGEAEYVFWVGCAGAFDDRAKQTTRAVAELLTLAGASYAVLGPGETCCGDPARRAGNEFLYQTLAQQNIETLDAAFAGRDHAERVIVTACPHCLNTLGNEYPQLGGDYQVIHHTQLLDRLVREGRLAPAGATGSEAEAVTYHDPCYLGRHNQVYQQPRALIAAAGAELAEMPRNTERSLCCGAGGGQMWMEGREEGTRTNLTRVDEALGTGASTIVTGCPFCRVMLGDGLTARKDEDVQEARQANVVDIALYLRDAISQCSPEQCSPEQCSREQCSPEAQE